MSQAVVNAVSSLANTWVSKSINTGDRMMDAGLITLCTVFLGLILSYITNLYTSKWNRNYLRSWWYWQTDPYTFQQDWYEYNTHEEIIKMDDEYIYIMELKQEDRHIYVPYLEKLVHMHTPIGNSAYIKYFTRDFFSETKKFEHYKYTVKSDVYYPIYISNGYPVYIARVYSCLEGYTRRKFVSEDKTNLTTVVYDFMKYINEEKQKEADKPKPDIKYLGTFHIPSNTEQDPSCSLISNLITTNNRTVNKRRTFDTLFFDDKERLLGVLEKFQSGTMYSKHLSLDNKLGILLYGPPGTGKTGTISAIANYTNRGILQINLMDVIINGLVDKLFDPSIYKQYVYVFDEFDHMMIEHFKTTENGSTCKNNHSSNTSDNDNDNENNKEKRIDWASVLTVSKDEERNKILEMMKESIKKQKKRKKTDFGYFLSKLDGLEDASGRVMVFCTNNPQILKKSYPALFRPGRIDMKLCLGNCTQSMYEDIIIAALELEDTEDIRDIIRGAKLPHDTWSPLDVINTALVNQSLSRTLDALTRSHHRSI